MKYNRDMNEEQLPG